MSFDKPIPPGYPPPMSRHLVRVGVLTVLVYLVDAYLGFVC